MCSAVWRKWPSFRAYCCPEMDDSRSIALSSGRHPVVEQLLPAGFFVPNSTFFGHRAGGPQLRRCRNSGPDHPHRTQCQRQELLPAPGGADSADGPDGQLLSRPRGPGWGFAIRIFTRVGAVDDLATGQSTFHGGNERNRQHPQPRHPPLPGAAGRNRAGPPPPFDGLSIAWAVAEHLAADIGAAHHLCHPLP